MVLSGIRLIITTRLPKLNRERENMYDYKNLFTVSDANFHLYFDKSDNLLASLKRELPAKGYLTTVDLKGVSDPDKLFKIFVDAFRFPDYFGYNWNAFDECIRDLSWLHSSSYVLVILNFEKMRLKQDDQQLLISVLQSAAEIWTKGRTFNRRFPVPPTPFHIVITLDKNERSGIIDFLKTQGVQNITYIQ
jgi:RNAse (barnase) inhibitor barstar